MALKQIKDPDRIVFLKEFTKRILLDILGEKKSKENIEIEKLRRKFIEPHGNAHLVMQRPEKFRPSIIHLQKNFKEERKPVFHWEKIPLKPKINIKPIFEQKKQESQFRFKNQLQIKPSSVNENFIEPLQKVYSLNPFQKIEPLLRDATILSIECQGPGKNLLVKRYNQVNSTKITLSEKEINSIINDYSAKSRIPVIGGIIKAAVGNIVISGIVSEFAGSRFIINKITPYSLLNK